MVERGRDGWRIAAPVTILLVVAAVQVTLVHRADLSPWKGGGFGMFAAVDGGAVRVVRIFVAAPGRSEELVIPPSLEVDAERAATFPRPRLLARLARRVAERERSRGRPVATVRVEAWSATLTDDGSQANARRLAVYELDAADVAR
jgi:hypothetical protein